MAVKLINANISAQTLTFKPGGSPASFAISVVNDSNQFASFQLEIIAAGSNSDLGSNWYKISPAISAKTPPGDSTKFSVMITDTPIPGFVGKMNVIVRISSLELREEDRQLLRLVIEPGIDSIPMQVELPVREFTDQPQALIEIPVRVVNPSQTLAHVSLRFVGVASKWLLERERRLNILPGESGETSFLCQLPVAEETLSQSYSFRIEATHPQGAAAASPEGVIKILPAGNIDFQCFPEKREIPASRIWLPQWRTNSTNYQVEYENTSNLIQQVDVQITKGDEEQPESFIEIQPANVEVKPGEKQQLEILVSHRRSFFGLPKKLSFIAESVVSDSRVNVTNEKYLLKLIVHPIFHPWLQLFLGILLLYLLWAMSWLNPDNPWFGHQRSVTSVQLNGVGDKAVSGSLDQSIIRWNLQGFTNPLINQHDATLGQNIGKAVRVVRYKPVDNDVVAAGLENGEIQLWDVTGGTKKSKLAFSLDKADRVLALEFSQDSNFLFSGHGSGAVLKWDLNNALLTSATSKNQFIKINQPIDSKQFNFSIYGLTLIGDNRQNLAIAGRYNNLEVWQWQENKTFKVPYRPAGSQEDYIVGLASAEYKPNLLATSDNQGRITLWNMEKCLNNSGECEIIDQWLDGHGGKAVRSVALTRDGCYLASGGDDQRVMLWPLTKEGKREIINGKQVESGKYKFNTVDVKVVRKQIYVVSGDDNKRVRLHILQPEKKSQCIQ
jgi:WD40 repeat protein